MNLVAEGQLRRNRVEVLVAAGGAAGTTPTARTPRLLTPLPRSRRFRRIATVQNAIVSNSIACPEGRNAERAEKGNETGEPPTNRREHRVTADRRATAAPNLPEKKLLEDARVSVSPLNFPLNRVWLFEANYPEKFLISSSPSSN